MGRKPKGQKTPSFGMAAEQQRSSSKGKKIESYEDTLEEGGVDDFMFKRDQIMFNPRDEASDEDIVEDGEEVLSIAKRQRPTRDEEMEVDDEEEEEEEPQPKKRKEKSKTDVSGKGRFGKAIVDSDEEEDDDSGSSGSSSEEEEGGWGRQYYSVPSTRREKEKEGEYDEKREEERELEEREVKRLQRKAREALKGEDYGLDDEEIDIPDEKRAEEDEVVPVPETSDPAVLLKYMEVHEPVKLALAREWPLVVQKLEKTQKGMQALEGDGDSQLHKGLGWLHYQTLLSYASTLAFYIHLTALPPAERPDLSSHPILTRLLELKKGVSDLEDLDFDAASNSDEDPLGENGWATDEEDVGDDEDELLELIKNKKDMMAQLMKDDDDEEGDDEAWRAEGLEDGELDDLMADLEEEDVPKKSKKAKKESKKKGKKSKSENAFPTLAEPAFFSSSKSTPTVDDEYDLGDPTSLLDADADDKERRKRSLAFHTSKIASTANRRAAAREKRSGGDEDIPYRDRQAARDAALRKQTRASEADSEPLSLRDMTDGEKKRARDVRDDDEDDGEGYYDLIKRKKTADKAEKVARHEEGEAERLQGLRELDQAGGEGPRSLTRAIEKNKGLTPRRSKAGRNPRVKKRLAYEKAKQKVGSQRAVYKGGQASLAGKYAGEKTGISTVVKSRQF